MVIGCKVYYTGNSFRVASEVRYSRCRNRARVEVGLSFGVSVTLSVSSTRFLIVVVFFQKRFLGSQSRLIVSQGSR